MPKKDVKLEHPMAGKSRKSKKILEDSEEIFDQLDQKDKEKEFLKEEKTDPKKMKSLKELLHFGNLTREVEVDGFHFRLRTLKHSESREVAKRIFLLSDESKLIESNIIQLGAALDRINGLRVPEAYVELFDEKPEVSEIDQAIKILSQLNNHLVGKLINEYFILSEQSKDLLNPQEKDGAQEIKK